MKNKVKLIGSQSTSVNLGSSGNSLSNLQASNSDLGKYPYNNGSPIPQIVYGNANVQPKSHENRSYDPNKLTKARGAVKIQFHKSNYENSASNSRSKLTALTMAN